MTRGYSLEQDLRLLINNPKYKKNHTENYLPELLSKFATIISLVEDNIFLNVLVEAVAAIPLNTIEFGRLSIAGLRYLLYCTYKKETPFATPEYEIFRYSAILAAKQVSNDACKALMKRLLTLEQIKQIENLEVENKVIVDHQKVTKELEPLVELIDFRRIKDLNDIRGMPIDSNYVWDKSACGSKLIIEDNDKIVCALSDLDRSWQSVRAKMVLENKGVFEWDIVIGKSCTSACVGVCSSENFNYETWAGYQSGWILDYHVNGTKYPEVSAWNNLPSKLYPVVSLCHPGRFRIQPHQKSI
ncbi:hypothetical protein GLOIN_2v1836088 [Rhizophagus clarus]|uniref:Uncharacterized protein n=1 Tax=Rhizophagus clarus TaxID=94130 RepID=A0A8H3M6R4_9GLOM|nr:hypothetical protein GLOIN_2v1836088 [Rhizophagus clarus]